MVTQYGMSEEFGLMGLESVENQYLTGRTVLNCADITASAVDEVVKRILKESYQQAKELLSHHRKALDEIAAFLIERESITGKEFMEIFHKIESDGDIPEDAAVAEENTAVAEAEIGVIGETAEDADETDSKVGIIHEYKNNRSIT